MPAEWRERIPSVTERSAGASSGCDRAINYCNLLAVKIDRFPVASVRSRETGLRKPLACYCASLSSVIPDSSIRIQLLGSSFDETSSQIKYYLLISNYAGAACSCTAHHTSGGDLAAIRRCIRRISLYYDSNSNFIIRMSSPS